MRRFIFALILVGAALLVASQFMPLFETHVASVRASVGSGTVGAAHGYGVLGIGVLALVLGVGMLVRGSRVVLAFIGLLGIAALAIALAHDLSHAREAGLTFVSGRYESAKDVVGVGLYVEIAGSLALLMASVYGFLLGAEALGVGAEAGGAESPPQRPRRRARSEIIERRGASRD